MDLHYVFKEQAKDISKIKSAMSEQLSFSLTVPGPPGFITPRMY